MSTPHRPVTEDGLALIRSFEGFRAEAYRDAAGVWTIGYGHTAMAGAPHVTAALRITRNEAETILRRDVAVVAASLAPLVTTRINDRQFAALVSFAYNVGIGNFKRSSVLAAVNAGDLAAVPRRLSLWVKAGGRTLPGLIRRRAAEAALFTTADEGDAHAPRPDLPEAKPARKSRTILASLAVLLLTAVQSLASPPPILLTLILALICGACLFIIRERLIKLTQEHL